MSWYWNWSKVKNGGYSLHRFLYQCRHRPDYQKTLSVKVPHHIIQRGNRREESFLLALETEIYPAWLAS
jgi:hypothetical protein